MNFSHHNQCPNLARNYNFDTKRSQPQSNVHNLNQTFTTPVNRSQPLSTVHNPLSTVHNPLSTVHNLYKLIQNVYFFTMWLSQQKCHFDILLQQKCRISLTQKNMQVKVVNKNRKVVNKLRNYKKDDTFLHHLRLFNMCVLYKKWFVDLLFMSY